MTDIRNVLAGTAIPDAQQGGTATTGDAALSA